MQGKSIKELRPSFRVLVRARAGMRYHLSAAQYDNFSMLQLVTGSKSLENAILKSSEDQASILGTQSIQFGKTAKSSKSSNYLSK
ncbi:hypothetical protein Nepgr_015914 [Nepenthes gracilis]|uniref:Uncharacterized protein n=1 Tax=Nepenthes gracilis TaxID=150966 RepID=A0AAD3SLT7_NEPGR|nr:hypothetical protein Nepgr_015914 [Nepenthes gracilis]